MPLLPKEIDVFPGDLLEGEHSLSGSRRWWTLYTRVRQEKSLSRELHTWGIPFYLPLIKKSHLHRGRKRSSFLPLFSSYVFLFASNDERVKALSTDRVAQSLVVPEPANLLRDLQQIQRLIQMDVPLTLESKIQPGERVRVRTGVLAGIEGIVHSRTKSTKLVVLVNLLKQGVSLEVEDFTLERLD